MTFWERVRAYANTKVRQQYMSQVHHDRKCERCHTWTSEVDGCASLRSDEQFDYMKCKRCSHVSKWDCTGMLPVLVPEEKPL